MDDSESFYSIQDSFFDSSLIEDKQGETDQIKVFDIPSCPICLMELSQNQVALSCGHVFHSQCFEQHYKRQKKCPICKRLIYIDNKIKIFYSVTVNKLSTEKIKILEQEKKKMQIQISLLQVSQENLQKQNDQLRKKIKDQQYQQLLTKICFKNMKQKQSQLQSELIKMRQQLKNKTNQMQQLSCEASKQKDIRIKREQKLLKIIKWILKLKSFHRHDEQQILQEFNQIYVQEDQFIKKIISECNLFLGYQKYQIKVQEEKMLQLETQLKKKSQAIKEVVQSMKETLEQELILKNKISQLQEAYQQSQKKNKLLQDKLQWLQSQSYSNQLEYLIIKKHTSDKKLEKYNKTFIFKKTKVSLNPEFDRCL